MGTLDTDKRTFWVTGASSGIGLEIARLLAKDRNYVFVSARSMNKLECLREAYPENIHVIPVDLQDAASVAHAEREINKHTDHLDSLIACAGTCEYDDGLRLSTALFSKITQVNYLGVVDAVRIALPLLRRSTNRPHIAAIGSLSSVIPFPRAAAYGASKAALDYFLQSLKIDLFPENIDVTIIRPGFVDTPLTQRNDFDMPFMLSSKDAAQKIIRGLHKRPLFYDFPAKLSIPLKIMRFMPGVWMRMAAQKFKKAEAI
ncbi:MAG: SDR family NAD(P)-dependent oxidoreductase [Agarilytica sp.]